MARWAGFVAKAIVVSVVLVAIAGGAAIAGVLAVSAVSGIGPKALVDMTLGKLASYASIRDADLDRVSQNLVSLRGEFSHAFFELESRVNTLEQG